jgi:hypothetical protein
VGDWIAAPPRAALPLHFSDGTIIRLDADARARVAEITGHGARVVVERGVAHARVVHREHAAWDITAGPFDVRVVGTAFEVGWDPAREFFTLSLEQGRVVVGGCSLVHERVVVAGETFRATCKGGRIGADPTPVEGASASASDAVGASSGANGSAPPPPLPDANDEASPPAAPRSSTPSVGEPSGSRWESLLASRRYREAIDDAEAQGLPAICDRADVAALLRLGDAARFGGRVESAAMVLRRLRERFPQDERASVAAFHLGRMAFDQSAYDDALGWFQTYLRERPTGPLAREASGRVVEALERGGHHERARAAASRYLQDFPNGPHAELARSIGSR